VHSEVSEVFKLCLLVAGMPFACLANWGASMTLESFLILLLVAGICGAIGQALVGYSRGGCLVSIALGFIGAIVGIWLARLLGLHEMFAVRIGGQSFPVLWSIMGAALFVAFISLFTRRWV